MRIPAGGYRSEAREFWLLAADLAFVFGMVAVCRVVGHRRPLRPQPMSTGPAMVCTRCATTVIWPGG